jgi:redox-sensitive bicupin YhaK (pirin superfamily)
MFRRQFIEQSVVTAIGAIVARTAFAKNNFQTYKMNKPILKITQLKFTQDFPGLKGVNMMAKHYPIDPLLVFTEYLMDKPVFDPHPHAGVSVMTYMLPDSKESFITRNSEGDFSYILPGGMHIMQAGSGMLHDEFPKVTGVETHGFQIWINHSDKDRLIKPKSMHAQPEQIPEIITQEYKVRIVHGKFEDKTPPYKMVTDVNLFHVFLKPNKSITIPAKEMAIVYGLNGKGTSFNRHLQAQTLVNYVDDGNQITLAAEKNGFEFMFGSGTPHHEPITYGGPFVMTTQEQILKTQKRYANGEMGTLLPYKILN